MRACGRDILDAVEGIVIWKMGTRGRQSAISALKKTGNRMAFRGLFNSFSTSLDSNHRGNKSPPPPHLFVLAAD